MGGKTRWSSEGSMRHAPVSSFDADILPDFMARVMVAMFFPVALAASPAVYCMALAFLCIQLLRKSRGARLLILGRPLSPWREGLAPFHQKTAETEGASPLLPEIALHRDTSWGDAVVVPADQAPLHRVAQRPRR